MPAPGMSYSVIAALFVVATFVEVVNSQGIVTTLRKRDLIQHLQNLKDDDQVSLSLIQKQQVSETLPPKEFDPSQSTVPLTKAVPSNTHEEMLNDTYEAKNSMPFANQPKFRKTFSSVVSEKTTLPGHNDSVEDSKEEPTSTPQGKKSKTDVKLAMRSQKDEEWADKKVSNWNIEHLNFTMRFADVSWYLIHMD